MATYKMKRNGSTTAAKSKTGKNKYPITYKYRVNDVVEEQTDGDLAHIPDSAKEKATENDIKAAKKNKKFVSIPKANYKTADVKPEAQ